MTIAVQILGKLRGTSEVPPNADADFVVGTAALEPNVARLLEGKRIGKRIHVPNRIVNFVIAADSIPRRSWTAASVGLLLLCSCGFSPMYARTSSGRPGPIQQELQAVSVDIIPDRPGQLLRQALQERLERSGTGTARRYNLSVDYGIAGEGIAVQQDSSITRLRLVGRAQWTLRAQDPTRAVLTSDRVRVVDDINIFNEQYFASDLENEAAQRRIAQTAADQIVAQLGSYFGRHNSPAIASR